MLPFRILLVVFIILILSYTGLVIIADGINLFPVFINDIMSMTWSGQFNLDFSLYLVLSGLWIAWRHRFSPTGIIMGIIASILGMTVFAPYLLFVASKAKGDIKTMFIGEQPS